MPATNGRLIKELKEVSKNDTSGVKAAPVSEGNLRHLLATVEGPSGTVYEGGLFEVNVEIGQQYPFEPPKMKFITKIWHPKYVKRSSAEYFRALYARLILFLFLC